MKKKYKHPSYYLISSAMDGDETAINYWHSMTRTYQSVVYVLYMMNTAMFILLLIWN